MTRCVVVTVDVRDSEIDEDEVGLTVGYETQLRYTAVVRPHHGESQPMLLERCSDAARQLVRTLNGQITRVQAGKPKRLR